MTPAPSHRRATGFTLIELLCVIAIMAIGGGLVLNSTSLFRPTGLTTAGDMVMEEMAFARELATTGNAPTEVWFLRATGTTPFTAIQIYSIDQDGRFTAASSARRLPVTAIVDSGATLSPLFSVATFQKSWNVQAAPSLPGFGTGYEAWCIRYLPDGTTTATQNLFLTLHDTTLGDKLTALPKNYAVVSLDSVTGAVTLYRP